MIMWCKNIKFVDIFISLNLENNGGYEKWQMA